MVKEGMFDYDAAMAELEKIAAKVESPDATMEDIDEGIKRADELLAACRAWLRRAKEHNEKLS